jgi:hypothetical protein
MRGGGPTGPGTPDLLIRELLHVLEQLEDDPNLGAPS